jgi:drug/metabolite transporter (DMT)-like permease
LCSAFVLAFENIKKFKLEAGVFVLLVTIFGWGYYYSFMKTFVPLLGPYMTTFYLEIGISTFIFIYVLLTRKNLTFPSLEESKYISLRSILLFLGSIFYASSVGAIGAGITSAVVSSSSIVTAVGSYFLLKEKLDSIKYLAIILSIIGLVIVFLG